jgi:hypothetical protein
MSLTDRCKIEHSSIEGSGLVAAAISGIREECARRASATGPQRSAFLVPAGRRIQTGMRTDISMGTAMFSGLFGRWPSALGTGHQ